MTFEQALFETRTRPDFDTSSFELRHAACPTCKRRVDICPDCGNPFLSSHPETKIICREHNVEAKKVGKYLRHDSDGLMGQEGDWTSVIYQCPVCEKVCAPSLERLEDTYQKEQQGKEIPNMAEQECNHKNLTSHHAIMRSFKDHTLVTVIQSEGGTTLPTHYLMIFDCGAAISMNTGGLNMFVSDKETVQLTIKGLREELTEIQDKLKDMLDLEESVEGGGA